MLRPIITDHLERIQFCHYESVDNVLLHPWYGPGLPILGLLFLGYWAFHVPDL